MKQLTSDPVTTGMHKAISERQLGRSHCWSSASTSFMATRTEVYIGRKNQTPGLNVGMHFLSITCPQQNRTATMHNICSVRYAKQCKEDFKSAGGCAQVLCNHCTVLYKGLHTLELRHPPYIPWKQSPTDTKSS